MILLFDLAGLLLDFRGIESTSELSHGTVDAERFGRFWSESPVADRLYRGQCTPKEFAMGAVAECGRDAWAGIESLRITEMELRS